MLYALSFLVVISGLLLLNHYYVQPAIDDRVKERMEKRRKEEAEKFRKKAEELRPLLEERARKVREEVLPYYREKFRDGPVGFWQDPRDMFSRVVTYEDWEFREDGTGYYIHFTRGGGETRYPFLWKPSGPFKIHCTAVDRDPENEDVREIKAEDPSWIDSMLEKEFTVEYEFFEKDRSVYLRSVDYVENAKPRRTKVEVLYLAGGKIKDELKEKFGVLV